MKIGRLLRKLSGYDAIRGINQGVKNRGFKGLINPLSGITGPLQGLRDSMSGGGGGGVDTSTPGYAAKMKFMQENPSFVPGKGPDSGMPGETEGGGMPGETGGGGMPGETGGGGMPGETGGGMDSMAKIRELMARRGGGNSSGGFQMM